MKSFISRALPGIGWAAFLAVINAQAAVRAFDTTSDNGSFNAVPTINKPLKIYDSGAIVSITEANGGVCSARPIAAGPERRKL